jgi:hypothetical protein
MKDARKGGMLYMGRVIFFLCASCKIEDNCHMTLFCAPCCQVGHANGARWASTTRFTAGGAPELRRSSFAARV